MIAKQLECGGCGYSDRRGLLEREVGRLAHEMVLCGTRVLGKGACAPADYVVAWSELSDILADRLHRSRDVRSRDAAFWPGHSVRRARDVGHAFHQHPITDMNRSRMNAYQNLAVVDRWLGDILER